MTEADAGADEELGVWAAHPASTSWWRVGVHTTVVRPSAVSQVQSFFPLVFFHACRRLNFQSAPAKALQLHNAPFKGFFQA